MNTPFVIVRAQAEDAAALLEYLKIIGGETDNLSFGPEGVPLSVEQEASRLRRRRSRPICAHRSIRRTMCSILPGWTASSSARPA